MRRSGPIYPPGISHKIKGNARETAADAAALDRVLKAKPLVPPHRHAFERGRCRRCGITEFPEPGAIAELFREASRKRA